jgi:hypothetical protein
VRRFIGVSENANMMPLKEAQGMLEMRIAKN